MTRDDIQRALDEINELVSIVYGSEDDVDDCPQAFLDNWETIRTVLQDRLNQPDWQAVAEEMKSTLSKIHKTAELYNNTAVILEVRDAIIKYHQLK